MHPLLLITVMLFLRTDCPVSNSYAPEIERISRQFTQQGVRFEIVFPDRALTPAQIQQYRHHYSLTLPFQTDPHRTLVKRALVRTTPEAAVFADGRLVYHGRIDNRFAALGKSRQAATEHDLEQVLQALVNGHKPSFTYRPAIGCAIGDLL